MSGHGANLIFFNTKIKIGRPEHSLPLPPLSYVRHLLFATRHMNMLFIINLGRVATGYHNYC